MSCTVLFQSLKTMYYRINYDKGRCVKQKQDTEVEDSREEEQEMEHGKETGTAVQIEKRTHS